MAGTKCAQVLEVGRADHYHVQMRLQVCTFASTNEILSSQTETTALLQQIPTMFQQVITMLQQGPVRQRSRTLSMHSQVEPVGFNSQTTRVRCHPCLQVHINGYHSQVVANTTTSIVTFAILSPDASLSYDRIKLRLEEYRTLLTSDSDTIELSTDNGKTVICRKQAKEMEAYLDEAEELLRDVVQSRDISTLVVLHHLRDLAKILDNLKLYDECRLTGNCALDLAEALGRRSLELRHEQAETLTFIAGLSVYRPRARTLFIQAVSICEEVVENDASHSNKHKLLLVLNRAGRWASDRLRVQWLGHAIQLMTKELPPTMVTPHFRSIIYNDYGNGFRQLKQYSNAIEAYHEALSICRTFVNNNPAKNNLSLARTLVNMGIALSNIEKYDDAIGAYKEALEICTASSTHDPLQYNEGMGKILHHYGVTLTDLNQVSEAVAMEKRAISHFRNLPQMGNKWTIWLCDTLYNYGTGCVLLGQHIEAVLAFQESILLQRALATGDPERENDLIMTLHDIAHSFLALGRHAEANTAANEAMDRNHGMALAVCGSAPNFQLCFVCKRAVITDSLGDGSPPLPFFGTNSPPQPAEHSRADASLAPAETPISATSPHVLPIN